MTEGFMWEHFALGSPCMLAECPVGLFFWNGELCLKTEYSSNEGRIDAFIVASGEFFWGAHPQTIPNQREQTVTPVLGPRAELGQLNGLGRFEHWSNALLASECRGQARANIDPEYSQFMRAVAERLASQPEAAIRADEPQGLPKWFLSIIRIGASEGKSAHLSPDGCRELFAIIRSRGDAQ